MEIVFNQAEIESAIKAYAKTRINLDGKEIDIKLTAGRGEGNFRAEITVDDVVPAMPLTVGPATATPKAATAVRATRSAPATPADTVQAAQEDAALETSEAQSESPFTDAEVTAADAPVEEPPKKSVSSLFGGKKSAE